MLLFFAFFVMAVLHFGGFVVLPLWLIFAPLGIWLTLAAIIGGIGFWASK